MDYGSITSEEDIDGLYCAFLKCAFNYYHYHLYDVKPMPDEFWTLLCKYYSKDTERYKLMSKIEGSMAYSLFGISELDFKQEIERVEK